jgi:hypothetical protein
MRVEQIITRLEPGQTVLAQREKMLLGVKAPSTRVCFLCNRFLRFRRLFFSVNDAGDAIQLNDFLAHIRA